MRSRAPSPVEPVPDDPRAAGTDTHRPRRAADTLTSGLAHGFLDYLVTSVLGGALLWGLLAVTHAAAPQVVSPSYPACLALFALLFAMFRLVWHSL